MSTFQDRLQIIVDARFDGKQKNLASALRLSHPTVSKWFAGVVPRESTIQAIADVSRVSYTWLTTGEGEMDELPVSDLGDALATLGEWAMDDPNYTGELLRLVARQRPEQFHALAEMVLDMCRHYAEEQQKKDGV